MSNIFVREESLVVFFLIEPNNSLDVKLLKYLHILVRMVTISLVGISLLDWPHESHELAWDDPVKIAILNSFALLILFNIESLEVIPFEFDGILQTLQALQQGTLIETVTFGGVSISFKKRVVWLEHLVSLLCGAL